MTQRVVYSTSGLAHFRHHPGRSTLSRGAHERAEVDWLAEPAVIGHRRLVHRKPSGEEIPVPVCATPAIIGSAGIVVAGYDGVVRFLDPSLTKEYWSAQLGASVYAPLVVDPTGPAILVGCIDGSISRLGLKGSIEWSVSVGKLPIYPAPLVLAAARLLVVATFHGRCFGIDLDDGTIRFKLELPLPWHSTQGGLAAWRDPYASPIAISETTFLQCCAECVLLIDMRGLILWEQEIGSPVRASPAFVPETNELLVVSASGSCRFIAIDSGSVRFGPSLGGRVVASPAVSGQICAIGTVSGDLFGVDTEKRTIAWQMRGFSPSDHSSVALLPSGDFVVVTARGNAAAIRATDGRFHWESDQRLGLGNQDPTMNLTPIATSDGHLYCASYSGNVYAFVFPVVSSSSQCALEVQDDNATN